MNYILNSVVFQISNTILECVSLIIVNDFIFILFVFNWLFLDLKLGCLPWISFVWCLYDLLYIMKNNIHLFSLFLILKWCKM